MKPIAIIGLVLLLGGLAGLVVPRIGYTETKPVVKLGPMEVDSKEDHSVWIPTVAAFAAIIVGAGLIVVGRKS